MIGTIFALLIGAAAGAVGMFFVAKNNKDKFMAALGMDFDTLAKSLLDETEVDEKVKKFIGDVQEKLKK
jgi:hypothetical protein